MLAEGEEQRRRCRGLLARKGRLYFDNLVAGPKRVTSYTTDDAVYRNTTPATPAQNRVRVRVRFRVRFRLRFRVSACHILRRCGRCSISKHP